MVGSTGSDEKVAWLRDAGFPPDGDQSPKVGNRPNCCRIAMGSLLEIETLMGGKIEERLDCGKIDRPGALEMPVACPAKRSEISKAGRRFGGELPAAD